MNTTDPRHPASTLPRTFRTMVTFDGQSYMVAGWRDISSMVYNLTVYVPMPKGHTWTHSSAMTGEGEHANTWFGKLGTAHLTAELDAMPNGEARIEAVMGYFAREHVLANRILAEVLFTGQLPVALSFLHSQSGHGNFTAKVVA